MTGKDTYGELESRFSLPAGFSITLECMKQDDHPFISGAAEAMMQDASYAEILNHQAIGIGDCATSFVHDGLYIIMDDAMILASTSRLKDSDAACWTVDLFKFRDVVKMSFERVDGDKELGTLQIDCITEDAKPVRHILRRMDVGHFRLLQSLVDASRETMN